MKPQLLSERQAQRPKATLTDELLYFLNSAGGKAQNNEIFEWLILSRPDITDQLGWKAKVSYELRRIAVATDKKRMGPLQGGTRCTWVLKTHPWHLSQPQPPATTTAPPQEEPITINAPAFSLENSKVIVHRQRIPRSVLRGTTDRPPMIDISEIPGHRKGGPETLLQLVHDLPRGKAYVLKGALVGTYSSWYYRLKKTGKLIDPHISFTVKDQNKPTRVAYLMNTKGE